MTRYLVFLKATILLVSGSLVDEIQFSGYIDPMDSN
jgi:hypothetical protein